jgi:hypothetical protein
MEIFDVKRVGSYDFRKFITQFISVRMAAFVHRVPLTEFITMVENAIGSREVN